MCFYPSTHHNSSSPRILLIAFLLILVMNVDKWPSFAPYRQRCVLFSYRLVFIPTNSLIKSIQIKLCGISVLLQSKSLAQGPKEIYKAATECYCVDCCIINECCQLIWFFDNMNENCHLIAVFILSSQNSQKSLAKNYLSLNLNSIT